MIQCESIMNAADNCGAQEVMCIKILGGAKSADVGKVIVVAVKKALPNSKVKAGEVHKAVVVRVKKKTQRRDGNYVGFDDNAVVLVNDKMEMIGTRVFGMVSSAGLRNKSFNRILSLAEEVFVMPKIVKSDSVIVISGRDIGKIGNVLKVIKSKLGYKVIVSGVNFGVKHQKSKGNNPGSIINKECPVDISNVRLFCHSIKKASGVFYKKNDDSKKVRVYKKSGR